jgi:hypothetical protein
MSNSEKSGLEQPHPEESADYDWQVACFEAFRERDEKKIPERIRDANAAIQARLSRLEPWPDGREMTALNEAVQRLRELRNQFPQ